MMGSISLTGRILRREIGRAGNATAGPTLVVVAGVHGNEPSGLIALERVFAHLEEHRLNVRGQLVGLAGNLGALARGERFLEQDMNRLWSGERMDALARPPATNAVGPEATEQRALMAALQEIFATAPEGAHLVDLHTSSSRSVPFFILGDTLRNREFARRFPAPVVLGFEEHIRGTLMEWVTSLGHVAIAIEGGQHDDPASIDHHEAAIWLALVHLECLREDEVPRFQEHVARLRRAREGMPGVVEIFHRHAIVPADDFRMDPGFANFAKVARGQRLGEDRRGVVKSPADGLVFLPLYQKRGDDGFFLARAVNPIWLYVSAFLRGIGAPKIVRFLPGVTIHSTRKDTLHVDLRVARFYADQVFHLLGYRVAKRVDRRMVVERRRER